MSWKHSDPTSKDKCYNIVHAFSSYKKAIKYINFMKKKDLSFISFNLCKSVIHGKYWI